MTDCMSDGHLLVCQPLIHFLASDNNVPDSLGSSLTPMQSQVMWLGRADYLTSLASEEGMWLRLGQSKHPIPLYISRSWRMNTWPNESQLTAVQQFVLYVLGKENSFLSWSCWGIDYRSEIDSMPEATLSPRWDRDVVRMELTKREGYLREKAKKIFF